MNPNHESLHVSVEVTTNPAGEDVRVFGSISEVVGPNDWLPTEETEPKARQDDHRLIMMIDVAGLEEVDISIDYLIHGVRYDEYTGYKQSGELTSDAAKTAALDKSGGTSTDNLNNFKIYALIIGHPHSPPEDSDADDQSLWACAK